jgi:6-pyruvoyltetrahydropterin/6-carboxytetrahydropterin synthase
VIKVFDHSRIESDIPWFQNKQPSSENMVIFIWGQLNKDLKEGKLHHIRLIETETIFTDYYGD